MCPPLNDPLLCPWRRCARRCTAQLSQSLHRDRASSSAGKQDVVTNEQLNLMEEKLKKALFNWIAKRQRPSASGVQKSVKEQASSLAPEAREKLHLILTNRNSCDVCHQRIVDGGSSHACHDAKTDRARMTMRSFIKCLWDSELKFGANNGLTEHTAAAWFMKVGHDSKGRMPIDVFVRRLFTGAAHVMSLEGSREGAFPLDKTHKYVDYTWKWQGMLQHAPRFAKTGVFAPSDWEEYATQACKLNEVREKPIELRDWGLIDSLQI